MLHDQWMPAIGKYRARQRKELVSDFNLTDLERELRDRSWNLVMPPHVKDWKARHRAELQRTGWTAAQDQKVDPAKYYQYLAGRSFRSSETRYERVITDMAVDAGLVGQFYGVARRVERVDRQRLNAVRRRKDAGVDILHNAHARVDENLRVMQWTWRALRNRTDAYRHAIDQLEIETPSDRLDDARRGFNELADAIEAAESHTATASTRRASVVRRSRHASGWASDDVVPQK